MEHYKQFSLIKSIIDQADPIDLLSAGAPDDEYDAEAKQIVDVLNICSSKEEVQKKIHEIFIDMFDSEIAGAVDRYENIANEVWKLKVN